MRTVAAIRCLRASRVFPAVRRALAAGSHAGFRLVEFSVQNDHVHLLIEADTGHFLSAGMRGLAIRLARAVNRALRRRGAVWADRFHSRALTCPRAMRHALVYVLMNARKHGVTGHGIDNCSSAPWFNGWKNEPLATPTAPAPVRRPHTWLAALGWRRHGLVGLDEEPRATRERR